MRVALVHPPEPVKSIASEVLQHPINIASLAAYLIRHDHEVAIWDYGMENYDPGDLTQRIERFRPELVGFSCMTPLIKTGHTMAAHVKERFPDIHTVVGGPHTSAIPVQTMQEFPSFDIGVVGEGEQTLLDLVRNLEDGKDAAGVAGVVRREDGRIVQEDPRPLIADLDSLPYPARHLIDFDKYNRSSSPGLSEKSQRITQLFTTRGCPVRCIFCGTHVTHRNKVRFRSASHVLGEVAECMGKFGIEHFTIDDDTFTYGKARLKEICDGFRDLGASWDCDSRVDSISRDIIFDMAASGCKKIAFGVETGSPRMLELIRKRITVEQIRNAFQWSREAGIISSAFIMIASHPAETSEDLELTVKLIREIRPDFLLVYIAVPYPGTDLYKMMKEAGLVYTEDWDEFDIVRGKPKWRSENFSPEELVRRQKSLYRRYYLRPGFAFRKLVEIKSWADFRYVFQSGLSFLRYVFLERRRSKMREESPAFQKEVFEK